MTQDGVQSRGKLRGVRRRLFKVAYKSRPVFQYVAPRLSNAISTGLLYPYEDAELGPWQMFRDLGFLDSPVSRIAYLWAERGFSSDHPQATLLSLLHRDFNGSPIKIAINHGTLNQLLPKFHQHRIFEGPIPEILKRYDFEARGPDQPAESRIYLVEPEHYLENRRNFMDELTRSFGRATTIKSRNEDGTLHLGNGLLQLLRQSYTRLGRRLRTTNVTRDGLAKIVTLADITRGDVPLEERYRELPTELDRFLRAMMESNIGVLVSDSYLLDQTAGMVAMTSVLPHSRLPAVDVQRISVDGEGYAAISIRYPDLRKRPLMEEALSLAFGSGIVVKHWSMFNYAE